MDREPLSLRFYAPIFAPRTHIPSSRIPSASCRRTSAISTRYCTRLSHIIDASLISVCIQLRVFLEEKLKRTGNAFLYLYNSFFYYNFIRVEERAARGVHACAREDVRGWAHEPVCVLTFRLYNLLRDQDRTTRGIKDVDCYRRSDASTYPDPRESREVVPRKFKRESVRAPQTRRIEPGDKRRSCQFEFEIVVLNPWGIHGSF